MRLSITCYLCLSLVLACALLCACRDDAAIRTLQFAPAAETLGQAGWERAAKAIPSTQTLGDYLAAQSTQPLDWTVESVEAARRITASDKDGKVAFHLALADDRTPLLASANSAQTYEKGLDPVVEAAPFKVLSRLHQVHRQNDGSARYRWAGCLIYDGPAPAGEIEIRATLLGVNKDGVRTVKPGKPRHATRRSGIPKWIKKGEFLCTELMSDKLDTSTASRTDLSAEGVLEMTFAFQDGRRRFFTLAVQSLDWREYASLIGQPLAVVRGGELKGNTDERGSLPDPALVTLLKQDGRDLLVRNSDGRQGIIKKDRLVARFDDPAPELTQERRERLLRLIRLAISGQPRKALSLFDETIRTRAADATAADVARRYPQMENAETLTSVIQPLSLISTPQGDAFTVFVWIKSETETVWQTLDTVLFDGDTMKPIQLRAESSN
jgi:hypothetical protein